jgi:hypothetical protein
VTHVVSSHERQEAREPLPAPRGPAPPTNFHNAPYLACTLPHSRSLTPSHPPPPRLSYMHALTCDRAIPYHVSASAGPIFPVAFPVSRFPFPVSHFPFPISRNPPSAARVDDRCAHDGWTWRTTLILVFERPTLPALPKQPHSEITRASPVSRNRGKKARVHAPVAKEGPAGAGTG